MGICVGDKAVVLCDIWRPTSTDGTSHSYSSCCKLRNQTFSNHYKRIEDNRHGYLPRNGGGGGGDGGGGGEGGRGGEGGGEGGEGGEGGGGGPGGISTEYIFASTPTAAAFIYVVISLVL